MMVDGHSKSRAYAIRFLQGGAGRILLQASYIAECWQFGTDEWRGLISTVDSFAFFERTTDSWEVPTKSSVGV